jgi:hypothetical protein
MKKLALQKMFQNAFMQGLFSVFNSLPSSPQALYHIHPDDAL